MRINTEEWSMELQFVAESGFKMRYCRGGSAVGWVQIEFLAHDLPRNWPAHWTRSVPVRVQEQHLGVLYRYMHIFPLAPVGREGVGYDTAVRVLTRVPGLAAGLLLYASLSSPFSSGSSLCPDLDTCPINLQVWLFHWVNLECLVKVLKGL